MNSRRKAESRQSRRSVEEVPYRASRFNVCVQQANGALLVFNSYNSALVEFSGETAAVVSEVLAGREAAQGDVAAYLASQGLIIPSDLDEMELANDLHQAGLDDNGTLGLMLLSHENCNFRCVYCYEEFKKNRMLPEVVEGVVALVRKRAPRLRSLSIGWFGGEPLLAFDIIEDVSTRLRSICATHGIAYSSQMTTNGYHLDADRAARCIAAGITRYQITLDGPAETHDKLRVLASGGPTSARIVENLQHLRDHASGFHVAIRVNFSPDNLELMPAFVKWLGGEFGNDERFSIRFRPIGRWGGPNDESLNICDHHVAESQEISLMSKAMEAGFGLQTWKDAMQLYGSICYAASPRHLVIGSDGTIYKCTVAFNDPRNHVGHIDSEGNLNLNEDLIHLWTRSGEETDAECRDCSFRPPCQGNLCPLERMDGRGKRCPTQKTQIVQILPLLAHEARASISANP